MKFVECTLNIIILNIIIIIQKILKNKKIIIFYHPNQKLIKIHAHYIEKLFDTKKNKYYVVFLHHTKLFQFCFLYLQLQ